MKLDIDYVQSLIKQIDEINAIDPFGAEFIKDGQVIDIPEEYKETWSYCGFNTLDFVRRGFWKGEPEGVTIMQFYGEE